MKLFKHTFYISNLKIEDGEVVECEPKEYTYTFSMTLKGMDLFEKEYGKSLFSVLTEKIDMANASKNTAKVDISDIPLSMVMVSMTSGEVIKALASSAFLLIEDNQIMNDETTVELFKTYEVYDKLTSDMTFVMELLDMAIECLSDNEQKNAKNKRATSPKKK